MYAALYTSVWWGGVIKLTSTCTYDPATKRVFNIAEVVAEIDGPLEDEYVTVQGVELRAKDGVIFDY